MNNVLALDIQNTELDNIVTFPNVSLTKTQSEHNPTEVFAIKRTEDIKSIQKYFLDKHDYRDWLYTVLGVNLGLRASDLTRLRWCDILNPDGSFKTSEQSVVREKKTGKFRYLVFNNDCKQAIEWYLNQTHIKPIYDNDRRLDYWVFKKNKLNPQKNNELHIARVHIGRILTRAAADVGIPYRVSTHSLRKTFGYRLYKANVPLEYIAKIFNHSSPSITLRYIGIVNEEISDYIGGLDSVLCALDNETDD